MSNWWKRFFGFEDEGIGESRFPTDDRGRDDDRRKSPGRFEDPNREIEVKVLHHYPNQGPFIQKMNQTPLYQKTERLELSKGGHESPRPRRTELDERPAYIRRPERRDIKPPFEKKEERKRISSEPIEEKKQVPPVRKTRFAPSTVASPVYGYRERPNSISEKKPSVIEQKPLLHEKGRANSNLDTSTLFLASTSSEPSRLHIEEKQPPVESQVATTLLLTDTLTQYDTIKKEIQNQSDSLEINDLSISHTKENQPSQIDQVSVEQPGNKESEVVEQVMDTPVDSTNNGVSSVRSRTETPRKSAIPYNVMMTRSDHLARRSQECPPEKLPERRHETQTENRIENRPEIRINQTESQTENRSEKPPPQKLSLSLLNTAPVPVSEDDLEWIEQKKAELSESLGNFNVKADVISHVQGPTVTRFEIRLHPGVKVNKVIGLTEDLKLTLSAKQIRIAPVPGKNTVGIEIPNQTRKPVFLKSLLQSTAYQEARSPLTAVLGQDISGQHVVTDLGKMPHGLIAGATGSGKSVCIHSLILSLIYKANPDELRLILIDPKVVELATYREMPHLAAPVITQPREAALALKWAVNEMERRYQLFADTGVRDLSRYNELIQEGKAKGQKIPYIVIIIDELADLMMTSPQDVEAAICRIAQKARAAGIHMLLATQRPSVDVITGLIKSNIPTRIAFGVSAQTDSRTILDMSGAERLLGQGDMLFSENGSRSLRRLQGTFVTDEEIERITETFHQLEGPEYLFDVSDLQEKQAWDEEEDELFEEAGYFVIEQGQASVSSLQRRFRIGYNRAARLVDQLEAASIISESNGSKPRQVLVDKGAFEHAYVPGEKTQI